MKCKLGGGVDERTNYRLPFPVDAMRSSRHSASLSATMRQSALFASCDPLFCR